MVKDLVLNHLPGKDRESIQKLLGAAQTPKSFTNSDGSVIFGEYQWDLLYPIGFERIFIYDHRGMELSPECEYLLIRLDEKGVFASWYIYGSTRWKAIVGERGAITYKRTR